MKKFLIPALLSCSFVFGLQEEELVWENFGPSVQEYNSYLQEALAQEDWWGVVDYADIIAYNFPESPFAQETAFLMGEAYFKMGQLELANQYFTSYLNHVNSPRHFEEAIQYKFTIAEMFFNGAKKPLFGSPKMPKIMSGKEDALSIYEEVITILPHSEFAAKSLLNKAKIEAEFEDFKPALEALDLLIRRFPKHDLAAEAFLEKNRVYLLECEGLSPDPNLLDLAGVNLRKFQLAFPREARLEEAKESLKKMEAIFAQNLFEVGKFYDKTKKKAAAEIYYKKVVSKYPDTKAAEHANQKLESKKAKG